MWGGVLHCFHCLHRVADRAHNGLCGDCTEPWSESSRFEGSWLDPHRRQFEFTLVLALRRTEQQTGLHIPIEMVWAILSFLRGKNFVALTQAAVEDLG